eukprot:TRINITY_DN100405_c0_g1_i1.p1 TRINITY_DN100405_c0_g1~~TRINITY_DN100405_c0_g1_i1.p1  ORF type:complete len:283 (+),score=79.65 TRINITY_DN100405_c0_g1_i1:89-937(+)
MDLLGGYGSDGEGGSSDADDDNGPKPQPSPDPADAGPKRKKVDISRLPISRPLAVGGGPETEEAPLKKAAELEKLRPSNGRSLLDSLPAPKATLGSAGGDAFESAGGGGARIDLSGIGKPKKKLPEAEPNVAGLLRTDVLLPDEIPEAARNHALFGGNGKKGPALEVGPDGPSLDDLAQMKATKSFTSISADEMKDPNWFMNNLASAGGPGLHKGKSVPQEISQYESEKWQQSIHANPNRSQKRKHQINWLAQEAMDKEAEMLDRNASGRLTKAQTQMKYGW